MPTVRSFSSVTAPYPTLHGPVRLYTTGSGYKDVVRATGGEDNLVIGISKRGVASAGLEVGVLQGVRDEFMGEVNTTVSKGDKLKCGPGGVFEDAGAAAPLTGAPYTAEVLQARTNAGATWLAFVPNGEVI